MTTAIGPDDPHINTLLACNRPKPTDANFQQVTSYKSVMTSHKVVSFISFYKDIEEETESTAKTLLHVMRDITTMCDVANSCHRHCAGELVREGRQRREDPSGNEELGITSRGSTSRKSMVAAPRWTHVKPWGSYLFMIVLFILCYSIRFYFSMIGMICMK